MRATFRKSKKGFTLVEVIVSVFIATIISVGFLIMFTSAYTGFFMLGGRTRAVNEAQALIEMYYTSPAEINNWTTWEEVTDLTADQLMLHPECTHFFKLHSETHNGEPILRITVLVLFQDKAKSVTISSLVS